MERKGRLHSEYRERMADFVFNNAVGVVHRAMNWNRIKANYFKRK